ncbi:hypothetical protein B0A48_01725 [Cryoendolithus antarcticus]|uniref:Uncharacterized protein n=1 Tax=Cryoendolithus antarcticus TaxID=1507870 RepID=A0A1V8TQ34_9PEZI|nr:hypothetical protein B0A48_01725 [Cryoendolithus antarcticus]
MSSLVHTLLNITAYRNPFLRTLVPSIGLAFGIQAAAAIPSILLQTERFYDLSGSLTYISCTALSLYLPTLRARYAALTAATAPAYPSLLSSLTSKGGLNAWNWRQVVLSAAVTFWAVRLGSFLFGRITADDGKDSRFDNIRGSPPKFFGAFVAQATWVSLCLMPVLALNSIPATALAALPFFTITDIIGIALYIGGIAFEATADRQKSQWLKEKKAKKHSEDFLTRGLWSKSRHPNYFGESTLWTGIATTAAGVMLTSVGQAGMGFSGGLAGKVGALAMAGVSPAFVTFLLLKVSGIPLSENKYDKRYGDRKDYQEWKKNTPMFVPKL